MLLGKPLTRLIDQGEQAPALMLVNTRLVAEAQTDRILAADASDGTYRCFEWERRPARGEEGMFMYRAGHHRAQENGNDGQLGPVTCSEESGALGLTPRL